LNADTGSLVWQTVVGPGSPNGGVMWGTATDGQRIYLSDANGDGKPYRLISGQVVTSGVWSALDPATGAILWQTANPAQGTTPGPPTVANGVVYVGSADRQGEMFALDATTGSVLWSFVSGQLAYSGPSIANGVVYWGSGYPSGSSKGGSNFFAFGLPSSR
jgi:polyvinyl alcohol dehydrogenase (cytochrome)